ALEARKHAASAALERLWIVQHPLVDVGFLATGGELRFRSAGRLRRRRGRTRTRRRMTARTAGRVLLPPRRVQVEPVQRCQRRQPGVDVGELLFEVLALAAADRAHELADLLDEPEQRALHA